MAFVQGDLFEAERDAAVGGAMHVLRQPGKVTRVFYRRLWNMLMLEGKRATCFGRIYPLLLETVLTAPLGAGTDRFLLCTTISLAVDESDSGVLQPAMRALCKQLFVGIEGLRSSHREVPLPLLTAAIDCLVERGEALLVCLSCAPLCLLFSMLLLSAWVLVFRVCNGFRSVPAG